MSKKDDLSPEEKLLHLIRRSGKKDSKELKDSDAGNTASQSNDKNSKSLKQSIEFKQGSKLTKLQEARIILYGIKSINFIFINRLIILGVFIVLAWFLWDLYFNHPQFEKSLSLSKHKPKPEVISVAKKEPMPYSYYQEEISKRNIFKSQGEGEKVSQAAPAGLAFKELVKDLNLLGIVAGDNPQVIIEDRKMQKTFFLYKGDYVGEMKVEAIYPDKVVLEFRGERISLFL